MKKDKKTTILNFIKAGLTLLDGLLLNKILFDHEKRIRAIENGKQTEPSPCNEPEAEPTRTKTTPICAHASGDRAADIDAVCKLLRWYLSIEGIMKETDLGIRFVDDETGAYVPIKVIASRNDDKIDVEVLNADGTKRITAFRDNTDDKLEELSKGLIASVYNNWEEHKALKEDLCIYGSTDSCKNVGTLYDVFRYMLNGKYKKNERTIPVIAKEGQEPFTTLKIERHEDSNGKFLSVTIPNPYKDDPDCALLKTPENAASYENLANIDNIRMINAFTAAKEVVTDIVRGCSLRLNMDNHQSNITPVPNSFVMNKSETANANDFLRLLKWFLSKENKTSKEQVKAYFTDKERDRTFVTVIISSDDYGFDLELISHANNEGNITVANRAVVSDDMLELTAKWVASYVRHIHMNNEDEILPNGIPAFEDPSLNVELIERIIRYLLNCRGLRANRNSHRVFDIIHCNGTISTKLHTHIKDNPNGREYVEIWLMEQRGDDEQPYMPFQKETASRGNVHHISEKIANQAYEIYKKHGYTIPSE